MLTAICLFALSTGFAVLVVLIGELFRDGDTDL